MIHTEKGFIYLWAMFAVAVAGIILAGTGQAWQVKAQREKEKELLFIGDQFRKAIMSYYDGATGGDKQYPDSLEKLLLDTRSPEPKRHLRKIYLDPMTNSDEWGLVEEPAPQQESGMSMSRPNKGIIGIYSLSEQAPIKNSNFPADYAAFSEAETYQDWQFVFSQSDRGSGASARPQSPANTDTPSSGSPFSGSSSSSPSGQGSSGSKSPFSSQSSSQSKQNPFSP